MTPKEKADDLIKKMQLNYDWGEIDRGQASCHAIVAVEEILKSKPKEPMDCINTVGYWQEVKKELESF